MNVVNQCVILTGLLAVIWLEETKSQRYGPHPWSARHNQRSRPNIVMILTDDQDSLLGSMKAMPKTRKIMGEQGATFRYAYSTTPMCCPARSSILTGLYTHNHNTYTNNQNCSGPLWQQVHEPRTFATYLQRENYNTAFFGKYLNEYNGSYVPPGWSEWVGLIRNSRFYNYSLNFNGHRSRHYDNYYKDYLTDVITNDTVTFLKQSRKLHPTKPILMVLSVPAPHGPEDAAPQYQHMFENNSDHRTPSWNVAPNPDKQWLLNNTGRMLPIHQKFTDLLQRRRLQTLQSVDDLVQKVHDELKTLGELDNTYTIYTSDHGYHLGQFGLVKGKAMPYEFDVNIPLLVRGPNIKTGVEISNIVANIDFAPTILDMAKIPVPKHMDGRSFLPLLKHSSVKHSITNNDDDDDGNNFVELHDEWRDTILLERGKLTKSLLGKYRGDAIAISKTPKQIRLSRICARPDRQSPCKRKQRYYCVKENDKWYKKRCRVPADQPRTCVCPPGKQKSMKRERKKQREFLNKFVKQKGFRPRFIRNKRSTIRNLGYGHSGINIKTSRERDTSLDLFERRCRILTNQTIQCDDELYEDESAWNEHKMEIDGLIKELRKALDDLRVIRRHLKSEKPELDEYGNEQEVLLTDSIFQGFGDRSEDGTLEDCVCDDSPPSRPSRRNEVNHRRLNRYHQKFNKLKRRQQNKLKRKSKRGKECNSESMKCFTHDNDHWKTPPKWIYGPFCFCPNANNNTYWCLRTVNSTHNFLFCEFITRFQSYYDLYKDPHQLKNQIKYLDQGIKEQLEDNLETMKSCHGNDDCHMTAGITSLERRHHQRHSGHGRSSYYINT